MPALPDIAADRPVLIAGPTASGKSALALAIAEKHGGVIINADAIQVYDNWRVLTARPSDHDLSRAPHALYGHIAYDAKYSVGHWLRDIEPFLIAGQRPIITGGTGLYFTALTKGLANIPPTPQALRETANKRVLSEGYQALLNELDSASKARIDQLNPMRVQRAWEVLQTTGKGLAQWHDETPPPRLPESACTAILFDVDKDWLNGRIGRRFDAMIAGGALQEARQNLADWDPARLSAKAIGAPELMAHLQGNLSLEQAKEQATIATRQFAKRQRTWFRSKMASWTPYRPD